MQVHAGGGRGGGGGGGGDGGGGGGGCGGALRAVVLRRGRGWQRRGWCTLLVVVDAAGPVAGVIGNVVRLRSAVNEVAGDVLHDVHASPADRRPPALQLGGAGQ
eukprot:3829050-Prymnesium_polylepis.2